MTRFVPSAGDLIWMDFDPQLGHEQAGRRPALVLSGATYNAKSSLAVVCPVTGHKKAYPFEVDLPTSSKISGVVLADQIRSVDWQRRHADFAGKVPPEVLRAVQERIAALLGLAAPNA